MITLTTPVAINLVLGGNTQASYNKVTLGPFTMDGIKQTITGTAKITATAAPNASPKYGTLIIDIPNGNSFVLNIPDLDVSMSFTLTGPQATAVIALIEAAQAQLENGLISLGAIAGTRSAGV